MSRFANSQVKPCGFQFRQLAGFIENIYHCHKDVDDWFGCQPWYGGRANMFNEQRTFPGRFSDNNSQSFKSEGPLRIMFDNYDGALLEAANEY